jgi:hypothetical protein
MMGSTRRKNFFMAEARSVTAVSTDCMGESSLIEQQDHAVGTTGQAVVVLATAPINCKQ